MSEINPKEEIKKLEETTHNLQNVLKEVQKKFQKGELVLDQKMTAEMIVLISNAVASLSNTSSAIITAILEIHDSQVLVSEILQRVTQDISKNEKLGKTTLKRLKELQKRKTNLDWKSSV